MIMTDANGYFSSASNYVKHSENTNTGQAESGIHQFKQFEFEIIYKLSNDFPVQKLCKIMDVNRSGFYKWRNRMNNVSSKKLQRNNDIELFRQYHLKYPTHGYRWLNAKIKLDLGQTMSDNYAQRCCVDFIIMMFYIIIKYHNANIQ